MVGGDAGCGLERLVCAGERCVHANASPAAIGEEAGVLGEAPACAVGAVAVGDAVTAVDPHPDLGTGVGDHRE